MVNKEDKQCLTGYHKLDKKSKDKHIERSSYVLNGKGELCIAGYHDNGRKGRKAWA